MCTRRRHTVDSGPQVNVVTNPGGNDRVKERTGNRSTKENKCDCCNAFGCNYKRRTGRNTSKLECLCCNASLPISGDFSGGEKSYIVLCRKYKEQKPTADLLKVTLPQMRAVVKAAKTVAAVALPQAPPFADASGLTPDQLLLFAKWVNDNPQVNTMIRLSSDSPPDEDDAVRFRFLQQCEHCGVTHSPELIWCPASLGMAPLPPPIDGPGCVRSQCERSCACAVKTYYRELNVRYQHRQRAFLDQRCELDIRHQAAYAREVAAEAITLGIGMFVSLPVLTLIAPEPVVQSLVPFLPTVDSALQVPRYIQRG